MGTATGWAIPIDEPCHYPGPLGGPASRRRLWDCLVLCNVQTRAWACLRASRGPGPCSPMPHPRPMQTPKRGAVQPFLQPPSTLHTTVLSAVWQLPVDKGTMPRLGAAASRPSGATCRALMVEKVMAAEECATPCASGPRASSKTLHKINVAYAHAQLHETRLQANYRGDQQQIPCPGRANVFGVWLFNHLGRTETNDVACA